MSELEFRSDVNFRGGVKMQSHATADLPANANDGEIRFDTTLGVPVYSKNGQWFQVSDDVSLSVCSLWLDANDPTTVTHAANSVSEWKDKSGNQWNAYQTSAANQPQYSTSIAAMNNKAAIFSTNINGKIGLVLPGDVPIHEMFMVMYYGDGTQTSFVGYETILSGSGAFGAQRIQGVQASDQWVTSSAHNNSTFVNGSTTATTTALPMGASIQRFVSNTVVTQERRLLYNYAYTDRGWTGGVGEFIAFNRTLNPSEVESVEGYLAHKWGLATSLPANHTYKTTAPSNFNPTSLK